MGHESVLHHLRRAHPHLTLASPRSHEIRQFQPADPALPLMTDFSLVPGLSAGPLLQIDQALAHMKVASVRFLFVKNQEQRLLGYITAYDILGEKPMSYLQSVDCNHDTLTRADVLVEHIMTPVHDWEVIDYSFVTKASIAQITALFNQSAKRYLLVVQGQQVRGLIAATRTEQATGAQLGTIGAARSFMEIGRELNHS